VTVYTHVGVALLHGNCPATATTCSSSAADRPTDRPHALSPVHHPSVRRPSVAGGLSVGPGSTVQRSTVLGLGLGSVMGRGFVKEILELHKRGGLGDRSPQWGPAVAPW